MTSAIYQELSERAAVIYEKVVMWRRDFHRYPELAGHEERTSGLVAEHLRALGLEVAEHVGGFGVVGLLRGEAGNGPVIGFRADMDALPLQEQTGFPYASKIPGVMHACGHDAHTAMLMGTAEVLSAMRTQLRGTVKFIFQPAEEGVRGAKSIVEHGHLDDVDYVERESCTNTEFYDKMRLAKGVPSTAAITPIQFCEKYCQYVDEGYTDVIHVPINKSGSSTYNNALMAQGMLREERPEHHMKIHLLDPHTYSMVFGWYLCEMARKLKNGAEISHVIQEFEKQMNCMEIILGPYSLKQMKKSGRISAAAAVMGELMGVRPIITLIDGKTKVESKVRGDDKVVPAMIELCKKRADGVENFDYMIGHTNIKQAEDLEKACRKAFGKAPLVVFELGGVVSANTGPDTVALVYTGHPRG